MTIFPLFVGRAQDAGARDTVSEILSLARKLVQGKDIPAAIVRYRQYLVLNPMDDDVRNELARAFSWESQYDSALVQYDVVIGHNLSHFDAHFGKCQALTWKQDYPNAIRELKTLITLSPENIDVFLLGGKIYAWSSDFSQSLEMYQKALALDASNVEALIGKCRALEGLGRYEEAFAEIADAHRRFPDNAAIQQAYSQLTPRPKNQLFIDFQNESFDIASRSDHRTLTAQYYRTLQPGLTLYAEFDEFRRFDQDDQSAGFGTYWNLAKSQSIYAYCLVSPNPRVTSTVDFTLEFTQDVADRLNAFIAYRLLDFKNETAHIFSPGISLDIVKGFNIKPRVYVSRAVVARTTSVAYMVQLTVDQLGAIRPFLYYAIGNEAYRGVTLDNVESSEAWSVTVGGRYEVSKDIVVTAAYQYLNRIDVFRSNMFNLGAGYYW